MKPSLRTLIELSLALGLLLPAASAQKPPAAGPAPASPPSPPTGRLATPASPSSGAIQPREDLVLFLVGRVATSDGTVVPSNIMVERICTTRVRQQVYATSQGDFRMELGLVTNVVLDASGDGTSRYGMGGPAPQTGIPRRELADCELRASVSGFRSDVVNLAGLDAFNSIMEVGAIVVQRRTKIAGTTLSAVPYKAPRDARRAYEEGLEADGKGQLAQARQSFEKAVRLYPRYLSAWFQLGNVLEKENQKEAARTAYTQATTIDTRFLPPYLSLASLACEAENWSEVLRLTGHILDLDPMNYAHVAGYILDLDPFDYTGAYFYNSLANYKLNKIDDAEKSALRAESLDVRPRLPRLHLLLAEIFARKNNYASAISEMRTYLQLVPHAQDEHQVRERLAELEKLSGPAASQEKPIRIEDRDCWAGSREPFSTA